jgi:hypothetical protein
MESLRVGKGGLPPLALNAAQLSGGKPPFLTLSLSTYLFVSEVVSL